MAATAKVAGDLVGDGDRGADFAGELAVGVGLDGDGDFNMFDEAKLFEDEDVGVIFVGVLLDFFERDVNGGETTVEGVFDAFDEVGFVIEDARGFFHEFAAALVEDGGRNAEIDEGSHGAHGVRGDGGTDEAEGVGRNASVEGFGGGLRKIEVVGLSDLEDEVGAGRTGFDDGLMREVEVVGGFVMVDDEDWGVVEAVFDGGVVEKLGEEDG